MIIIVHSLDPFLLARMSTELQMDGIIADVGFGWEDPWDSINVDGTPVEDSDRRNMEMFVRGDEFTFYREGIMEGILEGDVKLWLTDTNYSENLAFILENKNK